MQFLLPFVCLAYLSLAACKKTKDCQAFDSTILDTWFPYNTGDTIYFFNDTAATDTLLIREVKKTRAHTLTSSSGLYRKPLICETYGNIDARTNKNHPHWLNVEVWHAVNGQYASGKEEIQLHIKGLGLLIKPEIELLNVVDTSKYYITKLENITLHGITYNDVRLVEPATEKEATAAQLDKVYIARGNGIIGYRTYPYGAEYWVK